MNALERLIEKTFPAYKGQGIAVLNTVYPPMRVAGLERGRPCFVQVGKAPFDVAGYYLDGGQFIGAELKQTSARKNTLSIVPPDKKSDGVQYHQLAALAALAEAGGTALIIWDNGGEIGRLEGADIVRAKLAIDTSLKVEAAGKKPAYGSRSILWGHFTPVKIGADGLPLWLPT